MKLDFFSLFLGLGFALTGVLAFLFPENFFALLGDYYGVFNYHFVKDAGIAFFSSGLLILLSVKLITWRVPLTLGGSLFIVLHGLFHIQMLIMGMAPTVFDVGKEVLFIITPSILTALLLYLRMREQTLHKHEGDGYVG